MASGDGPALAHRSVSNIRTAPGQQPTPSTPHTPPRAIPGSYGSPATVRADDDFLLIEIGSRNIRVGFAGDSVPKAVLSSGPQDQRRAGDFRQWTESEALREYWAPEYEIWRYDLRDFNLGLFHDKLERMLRDAFTRHLLIDSRPRRAGLVLDSAVPIPLLSSVLDILFTKFQAPLVSLLAAPTMTAVAAGMRSALVIDMGWSETVVTSVYEYREVKCTRSIRAGKSLLNKTYKLLHNIITGKEDEEELREANHVISFSECQDIMCRLMWCRGAANRSTQRQSTQLDTVVEQDETEAAASQVRGEARVPLHSTCQPKTIQVSFEKLADVCDDAMFDSSANPSSFDDHELPLHWLVYQHLLQLPLDVRAVCMSRIMFTGGCSNILGIKERLVDEVSSIVDKRGWTPVTGKGVDRLRNSTQIRRSTRSAESPAPSELSDDGEQFQSRPSSIATQTEEDAIEAKLARNRRILPQIQGQLRVLHSLGPWAGASLLCQLKIPAMATVDKELWLQQGASGASRASDVDIKMQQRQSMGAAGLIRAGGGQHLVTRPAAHRSYASAAKRPSNGPKPALDIKHIRQHPELYETTCKERLYTEQADNPARIIALSEQLVQLQHSGRGLRERANLLRRVLANPATLTDDSTLGDLKALSREELHADARRIKEELAETVRLETDAQRTLEELALQLPNLTSAETPRGAEPRVLSYINEKPLFDEEGRSSSSGSQHIWRSHVHIGAELGILDFASASVTSGWGWYYLVGAAAQLEQALVQYALAVVTRHGWTQVAPPSIVYAHMGAACGFQPRDQHGEQQVYALAQTPDDAAAGVPSLVLAGTSEIPLAGMKAMTTLDTADLPLKRVAVSRCYRAEAGARGASTRGLYRVHEFTKVEMLAWTRADADAAQDVFDEMLDLQTEILGSLGLHARVLEMPASDLGASATRKVDMEAWFPSRQEHSDGWGEVSSASICTDYQTRRLQTRARPGGHSAGGSGGGGGGGGAADAGFPWTLNGTALAVPRVLAALLEVGWDEKAKTVTIPECLRPWMDGRDKIGPPTPRK
ncbi:hypothetical protein ARSEF1564_002394 [Beauveria bassiana]